MQDGAKQGRVRSQIFQLNWVRAIAALMVVGYHTEVTLRLGKYLGSPVFPLLAPGSAGVQLFFVLSGFVILYAHHRDAHGNAEVMKQFVIKRFRRLYPPLWIVLLIVLAMSIALPFGPDPSLWDVVASFLILPAERESILAVEWTLRHEVLFYLAFFIFLWNRTAGFVVFIGWGVVASLAGTLLESYWLVDFLISPNHLLFMLGMGVCYLYLRNAMPVPHLVFAAGVVVFAATWLLVYQRGYFIHRFDDVAFGIGATGILYGLCGMPVLNRPVRVADALGAASYSLYLVHYPLISALAKVAAKLDAAFAMPRAILFIAIVVICQAAGLLFHYYVEKPAIALFSGRPVRVPRGA